MANLFKSPELDDYFVERDDVRREAKGWNPIIAPFEAGKVIVLPNLKFDIDHGFWGGLETEAYPELKKLSSSPGVEDLGQDRKLDSKLAAAGLPAAMEAALRAQIVDVYRQVIPVYEQLFKGYKFTRRQVVWRLNTIMNENMHIDAYVDDFEDHFARLFINLDTQPRIWQMSYHVERMYDLYGALARTRIGLDGTASDLRVALNHAAFGGPSWHWWDRQPHHVAYFAPGDVWAVDSRQVAHQIFYGRRAVSFDFFVEKGSMKDPGRHYLAMADAMLNSGRPPQWPKKAPKPTD